LNKTAIYPCFWHWHSTCEYSCENEINKSTTGVLKWQDIQEVTEEVEVMDGAAVLDQDGVVVIAPELEMVMPSIILGMVGSLPTGAWRKRKWAVALDPVMRCIT
jgi:hypothetical protein